MPIIEDWTRFFTSFRPRFVFRNRIVEHDMMLYGIG